MDERDAAVVAKARDGDREAFRALVDRHSRYLFSLAHRMTGNAERVTPKKGKAKAAPKRKAKKRAT